MSEQGPYITGIGLATALGSTPDATWQALLSGQFITDHARVTMDEEPGQPRVFALARHVARQAIANAHWMNDVAGETALVVGTSKGAVEAWLAPGGRESVDQWGMSSIAADLSHALDLPFAYHTTLGGACASGLHALFHATMLIRSGQVRRALVVAVESSLHSLFLASFDRMGVLADPAIGCRPFDENRQGFLASEAAAAVTLEADGKGSLWPRVENIALGGDGFHLTGNDSQTHTLRRILRQLLASGPAELIHAHGTGTQNDPMELSAIAASVGESMPYVYSHKGALGHSAGASGLVAVVINCLAHRHQRMAANVRTTRPIGHAGVRLVLEDVQRCPLRRSVALAQGFGGAIAGVSLVHGE